MLKEHLTYYKEHFHQLTMIRFIIERCLQRYLSIYHLSENSLPDDAFSLCRTLFEGVTIVSFTKNYIDEKNAHDFLYDNNEYEWAKAAIKSINPLFNPSFASIYKVVHGLNTKNELLNDKEYQNYKLMCGMLHITQTSAVRTLATDTSYPNKTVLTKTNLGIETPCYHAIKYMSDMMHIWLTIVDNDFFKIIDRFLLKYSDLTMTQVTEVSESLPHVPVSTL